MQLIAPLGCSPRPAALCKACTGVVTRQMRWPVLPLRHWKGRRGDLAQHLRRHAGPAAIRGIGMQRWFQSDLLPHTHGRRLRHSGSGEVRRARPGGGVLPGPADLSQGRWPGCSRMHVRVLVWISCLRIYLDMSSGVGRSRELTTDQWWPRLPCEERSAAPPLVPSGVTTRIWAPSFLMQRRLRQRAGLVGPVQLHTLSPSQ